MSSTVWNRFVRTSALLSLVAFGLASVAAAKPAPSRPGRPRALNLFATSGLLLEANRIACGIDNIGQVCVAFSGSPVGGLDPNRNLIDMLSERLNKLLAAK